MNKLTSLLLFWLCFIVPQLILAEPLATRSIAAQIQQYSVTTQGSALALLEKLVNINSGTTNIAGVRQIGQILRPSFEQLGFKTYWVEEPANMHRAGTLFAERKGSKGRRILLIGHLDTVFPSNSTFQHFNRHGNIATGPGVIDDKGGDIAILYALKALQAVHALDDTTITVALVGDEEDSGKPSSISRRSLRAVAQRSDIALDFEFASDLNTATIARRGTCHWAIKTQGNEGHSSQIFQPLIGYGAILEMARILNTMRTQLSGQKYLTFNPGLILGGVLLKLDEMQSQGNILGGDNIIAKVAVASGDLRFLNEPQKKAAEKEISAIVAQHLPNTNAQVSFVDGIPSMLPSQSNMKLLNQFSQVSTRLGYGPVNPVDFMLRGAADISYIAAITPENLSGIGPYGSGAHSSSELLDIRSLPIAIQRAALLVYQLTHE